MNPPGSSTPSPDDFAGALDAMRREWAELRGALPLLTLPIEREDRYERALRQEALLRDFLERHRTAFAAPDLTEQDREPQKMARLLQLFLEACEKEQRTEEGLLQQNADLADVGRELAVAGLQHLALLESMPQERWDALPTEERLKLYALLEALRPARAAMLANLPIDLRREWEQRLGE